MPEQRPLNFAVIGALNLDVKDRVILHQNRQINPPLLHLRQLNVKKLPHLHATAEIFEQGGAIVLKELLQRAIEVKSFFQARTTLTRENPSALVGITRRAAIRAITSAGTTRSRCKLRAWHTARGVSK